MGWTTDSPGSIVNAGGSPRKNAALFKVKKGGAFLFFYLIRLLPRRSAYFVSPHA